MTVSPLLPDPLPKFTKTEQKLFDVLKDGLPHTFPELFAALGDPHLEPVNVNFHLTGIRHKLKQKGVTIKAVPIQYRIEPATSDDPG